MFWMVPLLLGGAALFWPKKTQASLFSQPKAQEEVYGPNLPAGGLPVNQTDLDTLARTIWGEARGEGMTGMWAVANVIMNRYRLVQSSKGRAAQWGSTVAGICRKKYQFSCWLPSDPNYKKLISVTENDSLFRTALSIAKNALQYRLTDITGGATFYHTTGVAPAWSKGIVPVRVIGSHKFYTAAQVA
jgi:spore germination cell wall hydrolase CwlJ-like protein